MKYYLSRGDRFYSTGVYLRISRNGGVEVDGVDDDSYFDGKLVNTDEGGYYIEYDEEETNDKYREEMD